MIDIKDIKKSFGSLQVLKGIDLHIDKGEVVSIVGPSGAGKTTLLQIIGTLDKPDSGSININGIDVRRLNAKQISDFRNQHIGFVFQFHQLLPEFTALENIMIPAYIAGKSHRDAKARAEELLAFMGLEDRSGHKPNELSGGEKQRVAVARALVNHPAVILADEPSGSLDSQNKAELHQLFFDLRDKFGQTFVIVTHDEQLATITDRTIHMRDGLLQQTERLAADDSGQMFDGAADNNGRMLDGATDDSGQSEDGAADDNGQKGTMAADNNGQRIVEAADNNGQKEIMAADDNGRREDGATDNSGQRNV